MKNRGAFSLAVLLFATCTDSTGPVVSEPTADFSFPSGPFFAPTEISFQNLSQNASSYLWDFGDGSTSTEKDARHIFSKIGLYFVTLTARGKGGEVSITKRIEVDVEGVFQTSVVLAIDTSIVFQINQNLNQFMADLASDGYRVVLHDVTEMMPSDLRRAIQDHHRLLSPSLEGVIFIGQVPIPTAKFTWPNQPGTIYQGLSLQYYMDLDGDYSFEGGEVTDEIDSHTGRVEIEIWTSILPQYGDQVSTAGHINDYLVKNHAYRSKSMVVQKGFIKPVLGSRFTTEALYNHQYQIIKDEYFVRLNQRGNFFLGIDNNLGDIDRFPTSRICYEREMMTDKYDVASIGAHGSPVGFGFDDEEFGSIMIDITFAQTKPIKPVFLLEHSCNTADIRHYPNLASEFLYNRDNNVLVFAGATGPQGGMGITEMGFAHNYEAELLTSGESIGNAHFAPMRLPYIDWAMEFRETYSAQQILLGDGTLRLQEFMR